VSEGALRLGGPGPAAAQARRGPLLNHDELIVVTVQGQVAHPIGQATPYRIGYDGVPRVLPGTGGIVLNRRIGDLCVGLAGDHVEPGVALHNNTREVVGPRDGPNNALITYACVGNVATVVSGRASGQRGLVTGKHGGINHVLVDFPTAVLERLAITDRIQIRAHGLGLRLLRQPDIEVLNCAPALLARWGLIERDGQLRATTTSSWPTVAAAGAGAWTACASATSSPSSAPTCAAAPSTAAAASPWASSCTAIRPWPATARA
jgi:Domain of unknown function (DUF4438)